MGSESKLEDCRIRQMLNSLNGESFVLKNKGWDPDGDCLSLEDAGLRFHRARKLMDEEISAWAPSETAVLAYLETMRPGAGSKVERYRRKVDGLFVFVQESISRRHREINSRLEWSELRLAKERAKQSSTPGRASMWTSSA